MDLLSRLRQRPHVLHDLIEEFAHDKPYRFSLDLAFLQLTQAQEVLQQVIEMFDGVFDALNVLVALLLVFGLGIAAQQRGGGKHRAQRRPELVRSHREQNGI